MPNEVKKKIGEQINRSPEPLRSYIHKLETCSPADLVQENAQLQFEVNLYHAAATILVEELRKAKKGKKQL